MTRQQWNAFFKKTRSQASDVDKIYLDQDEDLIMAIEQEDYEAAQEIVHEILNPR
jgi:hypothetical protein